METEVDLLRKHFEAELGKRDTKIEAMQGRVDALVRLSADNPMEGGQLLSGIQVGKMLCVTTRTLRYWDTDGLLRPLLRTAGQHRRYRLADVVTFQQGLIETSEDRPFDAMVTRLRLSRESSREAARKKQAAEKKAAQ